MPLSSAVCRLEAAFLPLFVSLLFGNDAWSKVTSKTIRHGVSLSLFESLASEFLFKSIFGFYVWFIRFLLLLHYSRVLRTHVWWSFILKFVNILVGGRQADQVGGGVEDTPCIKFIEGRLELSVVFWGSDTRSDLLTKFTGFLCLILIGCREFSGFGQNLTVLGKVLR